MDGILKECRTTESGALFLGPIRMPLPRLRMMKFEVPPGVRPQEVTKEDPWMDKIYNQPPAAKRDAWQLEQRNNRRQKVGWFDAVGHRGHSHSRSFQPVHRGIPHAPESLEAMRVSNMFAPDGKVHLLFKGEWSSTRRKWGHVTETERWTGYTLFNLRRRLVVHLRQWQKSERS